MHQRVVQPPERHARAERDQLDSKHAQKLGHDVRAVAFATQPRPRRCASGGGGTAVTAGGSAISREAPLADRKRE